jgi:hypothetical protein
MDPLSASASKSLFEQFLSERRYLKNVTPRTIEWYGAWVSLSPARRGMVLPSSVSRYVIFDALTRQLPYVPPQCN